MLAPSALAAGAARLRQALRACRRRCAPAFFFFFFLFLDPKMQKTSMLALFGAPKSAVGAKFQNALTSSMLRVVRNSKAKTYLQGDAVICSSHLPIQFCLPDPPEAKITFLTFGKSAKRYARTIPNKKSLLEHSNRFHFENKIEKAQGYFYQEIPFPEGISPIRTFAPPPRGGYLHAEIAIFL